MKQTHLDTHPELPLDPDAAKPGIYKWPPHLGLNLLIVVFVGGSLGTLARYWVSTNIPLHASGWPLATFTVNILGAFALGLLLESLFRHGKEHGKFRLLRLGMGTGFIGGFTTYSALIIETSLLVQNGQANVAAAYAAGSLTFGIVACAVGIRVATKHHHRRTRRNA